MPKYVLCKFRPEDSRSYTYLLDGHTCAIGDEVKVPDNRSDGWKRVTVSGFSDEEPKFPCKAVLGIAPPREPQQQTLEMPANETVGALDSPIVEF